MGVYTRRHPRGNATEAARIPALFATYLCVLGFTHATLGRHL